MQAMAAGSPNPGGTTGGPARPASLPAADAAPPSPPILGYIHRIPPESPQARRERHGRVARRREGIPLMVHRGAEKEAPENTLEAYAAAMDLGADGVEIDIHRTADGVLVLHHDDQLGRTFTGSGKLRDRTYYELLQAPLTKVYGTAASSTRIPTLAAFLQLARRRAMLIHLDVKQAGIQDDIIRMIEEADMWDHLVEVNGGNADRIRPDTWNRGKPGPHNKVKLIPYKGWAPEGGGDEAERLKAIRAWLPQEPGRQMVFCKNPRLVARAMGREPRPSALPEGLRAQWGPGGVLAAPGSGPAAAPSGAAGRD